MRSSGHRFARALSASAAIAAAIFQDAAAARADEPAPSEGFLAGAATFVAAFTAGGAVLASADGSNAQSRTGWLLEQSGFVLAPIVSHAPGADWGRGLLFASPAAAAMVGTGALFQYDPGTILHGSLPEQRWMWGMFGVGLVSGVAGVVDVVLPGHSGTAAVRVVPVVARGEAGLTVAGTL